MVALSIFLVVSLTSTPKFDAVNDGLDFVQRLLTTFLIGLAVATGVSLFVLPITSRRNVFRALRTYTADVDSLFEAQTSFVKHKSDILDEENVRVVDSQAQPEQSSPSDITSRLNKLGGVLSKIKSELTYTSIEPAWGKLSPEDFTEIHEHLNLLFLSLSGLSMLPEASQNMAEVVFGNRRPRDYNDTITSAEGGTHIPLWQNMVNGLEERLASTRELVLTGLTASFELLEIPTFNAFDHSRSSRSSDLEQQESEPRNPRPKSPEFFYTEIARYGNRRQNLHQIWPSMMFPSERNDSIPQSGSDQQTNDLGVKEHLLVFLFLEQLQNEALQAVHCLLSFAEDKVRSGVMRRNRLVLPKYQHIGLLAPLASMWQRISSSRLQSSTPDRPWASKDAEHLAPTNWWEQGGSQLRVLTRLLTCAESKFGARVAMASVSVAILAYIRQTQEWFTEERVIWVMIVIVIGMKAESGASTFGYLARVAGTVISTVLSLIVWYIVDGHTAGVLVFLYFANVFEVSTDTPCTTIILIFLASTTSGYDFPSFLVRVPS